MTDRLAGDDAPNATAAAQRPLSRLTVVECSGCQSTVATSLAVSFAGMMAARFGARVVRAASPQPAAGGEAVRRFVDRSKHLAAELPTQGAATFLGDDPDVLARCPGGRTVLVRPTGADDQRAGELALMARTGLLDIFGRPGEPPRPLPGHQLAYAAGLAVFNALVAMHLREVRFGVIEPARVSMLDVALWINWKHFLAGWRGETHAGVKRVEEWTTLRCEDGFIALTFQDRDMKALATMTGNPYFLSSELATRALRKVHVETINRTLEEWSVHRTRAFVAARAKELRLPVGPVLSIPELLEDNHLLSRGFWPEDGDGFPRLPLLWNGLPVDAREGVEDREWSGLREASR